MPIGTSEPRPPGAGLRWTAGLAVVCLGLTLVACEDDVGRCCRTLDEEAMDLVPMTSTTAIRLDPQFDCSSLTCVVYRGSDAFCTAPCFEDEDCPEDFVCRAVLEADPGPDAQIRPSDRFCVRAGHACRE
jgi:hypothetical protein